jgi:hypothetical protein
LLGLFGLAGVSLVSTRRLQNAPASIYAVGIKENPAEAGLDVKLRDFLRMATYA